MKYLILFLISLTASASYLPESKIGQSTDGMTIHSKQAKCEAQYSEPCIKFSSNESYKKIKPDTWLKMDTQPCVDNGDCDSKFLSLICSSSEYHGVKNYDQLEVYCTKFEPKHIIDDMALKAAHESSMATQVTTKNNKRNEMIGIRDKSGDLTSAEIKSALKFILNKNL